MKLLALIFFAVSYLAAWRHNPIAAVVLVVCSCVLVKFSERRGEKP